MQNMRWDLNGNDEMNIKGDESERCNANFMRVYAWNDYGNNNSMAAAIYL